MSDPKKFPDRRVVLKGGLAWGIGLGFAPGLGRAQDNSTAARPRPGDLLVNVDDTSLAPLGPQDILAGAPVLAWALDRADGTVRNGSRLNRVLLMRLDPERLAPETKERAADGVVAYTAICTHTGCEVTGWLAAEQLLQCACHASKFDPSDGARVVEGPAPRTLPALPLGVENGRLVVSRPFTSRVGFESA
ncbi:MAG: 2Fe-2S ferredoxin [Acidobacteria bacterium]|nr:MAG: 2Fe-2S ferredoxin [Acidobacteriota bacterium]